MSNVQFQRNKLRTTEEQPSNLGMVRRARLMTSIKQWTLQTKHKQMWKLETAFRIKKCTTLPETLQQQLAATQPESAPQKVTPQVIRYNPRTQVREKQHHQQHKIQQRRAPPRAQLDMGYHIFQKYILEETTGAEKACTGREYTSNSVLHTRADTRRARHQATHTLETDQGTTSGRKAQHKIGRR